MDLNGNHRSYWRKNLRLTGVLLLIWFSVTFGVSYFARELSFSYWMAAQGSLVVYGLIIAFYAWAMHRLDVSHGVQEPED